MKPGSRSQFSDEERLAIKRRIWEGEIQRVVAESTGLSLQTIHSIVNGSIWKEVLWPDGLKDALSDEQRREIARKRFRASGGKRKTRHHIASIEMETRDKKTIRRDNIRQGMLNANIVATEQMIDERIAWEDNRKAEQEREREEKELAYLRERRKRVLEETEAADDGLLGGSSENQE